MASVEIHPFAELVAPDERTLRFSPLGLSLDGLLTPEAAAEFEQMTIASADLIDAVPDGVRASFERLRTCHSYGVLWYEAFTVAADLSFPVLEQALRERFVEFYGGSLPVGTKAGLTAEIPMTDFNEISDGFRPGGLHARAKWRLRPNSPGPLVRVPLTLGPLIAWAQRERLLQGQRNKRTAPLLADMRNRSAHGAGFRVGLPNESARRICDLAETINRLWGEATPGGRLYPAPLVREVVAVAWSADEHGMRLAQLRPDRILERMRADGGDWTYILILAVPTDKDLLDFDTRYELTSFPCELVWGPGTGLDAFTWWQDARIETDWVEYLDRLFAVRVDEGKTYLPQRPETVLGLPADRRSGIWHVIRSDFPLDAFAHVRHLPMGECQSSTRPLRVCPIEEIAIGTWEEMRDLLAGSGFSPSISTEAHVPRPFPFPPDVGYE